MIEETDFETYLYLSNNKFEIILFDKKHIKNLFQETITFENDFNFLEFTDLIKFLDKNYEDSFDLFGPGWDQNNILINFKRILRHRQFDFYKYKTYRGLMGDKSDEIPKYKFIL